MLFFTARFADAVMMLSNTELFDRAERAIAETGRILTKQRVHLSYPRFGQQETAIPLEAAREDRLSMARRHVREGELRIARQKDLIAKLDREGHADMPSKGRIILGLFKTTLRLACEDLARLERKA